MMSYFGIGLGREIEEFSEEKKVRGKISDQGTNCLPQQPLALILAVTQPSALHFTNYPTLCKVNREQGIE